MLDPKDFPFCFEFFTVEKTIQVAVVASDGQEVTIRLDALRNEKTGQYVARGHCEDDPDWDFPSTHGNTAEEVLRQALSFVGERCRD